jgi:hypothetical protein
MPSPDPVYVNVKELEDGEVQCTTEYRNDLGNGFQLTLITRGHYVDMELMHIVDGELENYCQGVTMPKNAALALTDVFHAISSQVEDIDKSRLS